MDENEISHYVVTAEGNANLTQRRKAARIRKEGFYG
jgi:hypothetical protein